MNDDSKVLNISLRGWIALLITFTMCVMSYLMKEIKEPLYSASLITLGFYFGQKSMESKKGGQNEKVRRVTGKPVVNGPAKPSPSP